MGDCIASWNSLLASPLQKSRPHHLSKGIRRRHQGFVELLFGGGAFWRTVILGDWILNLPWCLRCLQTVRVAGVETQRLLMGSNYTNLHVASFWMLALPILNQEPVKYINVFPIHVLIHSFKPVLLKWEENISTVMFVEGAGKCSREFMPRC